MVKWKIAWKRNLVINYNFKLFYLEIQFSKDKNQVEKEEYWENAIRKQ